MSELRSAFIAVIGRPNVGKSSLINRFVGQKVSIVSDKPQTTRTKIMGVTTNGNDQFVFVDTPGFHKPKNRLGESMIKAVGTGMSDVDAVLFVVDAAPKFKLTENSIPQAELALLSDAKKQRVPLILVINKIDLLSKKDALLPCIAKYAALADFKAVVPVSAVTGDGTADLLRECNTFLKPAPHYFDAQDISDQPDRVMVGEIIREKLLHSLDKEIPHGIAVDLEQFIERDRPDGRPLVDIVATIYCEKESHKGIIIGKNGSMLKHIGILSRKELEDYFGCCVSLKLWVKTKEDWRNRPGLIHNFGLD